MVPSAAVLISRGLQDGKYLQDVTREHVVGAETRPSFTTEGTEEIGNRFRWRGDSDIVIGLGRGMGR
jgi:hypothetical protein